jgi:hypothetical protein
MIALLWLCLAILASLFKSKCRLEASVLIISPPSLTALPDTLWPPPRTDTTRPLDQASVE